MHVGRDYPYHPIFWATEAWFWRGFVPWKLFGSSSADSPPPWDNLFPWSGVSQPGVTSASAKSIHYDFIHPVVPSTANTFTVTMARAGDWPDVTAKWKIVTPAGGLLFANAAVHQVYPQRLVFVPGFPNFEGHEGYSNGDGPFIEFRPATYAEGGSPYP